MILSASLLLAFLTTAKGYSYVEEECLNYTVYPVEYELTVMPHILGQNGFYYDGEVAITVIAKEQGIRVIELDAVDLEIHESSVGVWYGNTNILNTRGFEYNKETGKLYLYLREPLKVYAEGSENRYRIKILFRKMLDFKEDGVFMSSYSEEHINRFVFSTRLHSDRARRMFPCFDNPLYAATFRIRVYLPPANQNPSQMIGSSCVTVSSESRKYPSQDGYTIIEHFPSYQIAPYQIGLHLSHYMHRVRTATVMNDTVIVWAPAPMIDDCNYILNLGATFIDVLYRFSVTKRLITNGPINIVPIPMFIDGYEIDSWNLLTNGDYRIMVNGQYTSVLQRERLSFQLSQQLCRVWLGNPGEVTGHTRWREHWFKEGMATYLAYFLLSESQRNFWSMPVYGFETRIRAMDVDWREATPPLGSYNKTLGLYLKPHERLLVSSKTAAILWMVANWMRSDIFHITLQNYIELRRGQFISLEDFAVYLQSETVKCEFFKGYTVSDVLSSWVNQPGYPVITVQVYRYNDSDVIKLQQKHFTFNNHIRKGYIYKVPISYTTRNEKECFSCNQPKFIIGDTEYIFKESINSGWIILNRNASGYYRVNYDDETWKRIIQTLKSPERTKIDPYNRAQIVNDAFALYVAGEITHTLAQDILECLDNEENFVVWESAFAGFELLKTEGAAVGMSKRLYEGWKEFMNDRISTIYKRLANEFERDHQTRMFNSRVITFACQIGLDVCLYNLKPQMDSIRRREAYDPDLREICYYELQKDPPGRELISKNMNRFEIEDRLSARNKFLRENEFMMRLPETTAPPMPIRTSDTTTQVTPLVVTPAAFKPSSAITVQLSTVIYVACAAFLSLLK